MPRFKPYNYDQNSMVVINYRDQLQPGTFEHAIHFLVDKKLDLSIFDAHYSNDDGGRPAYDRRNGTEGLFFNQLYLLLVSSASPASSCLPVDPAFLRSVF